MDVDNNGTDVGQSSDASSVNGSSNGSNGDYEFVSTADIGNNGETMAAQSSSSASLGDDYCAAGAPIQIVKVSEERHFELDLEALSAILLRDSIRDKPVVVVSIAGDFRKGI